MGADTIAAVATAPGRGGIAVVRVSGERAFAIAERLCGRPVEPRRVTCARLRDAGGETLDEAVVIAFAGPASYTGEDVVEFQCHGGGVTPRRILEAAYAAGARPARRGEFTERAFLNGRLDYDQAESVLDLIESRTDRAAKAALEGLAGRRHRERSRLYDEALSLSTDLEHVLDVDEDDLPADFQDGVARRLDSLRAHLRGEMERERRGKILRDGALVVLAGPPNAGKSSLLNALLGENRAIVSDTPGTTRDSIEEWLDLDGWPVRLVDTAGIRESADGVEAEGVRRARSLVERADVVLDLGGEMEGEKCVRVHAKCDLGRGEGLNVSSVTGEGLDALRAEIAGRVSRLEREADEGAHSLSGLRELDALFALGDCRDLVLAANAVRSAADALGREVGAVYSADLLDRLFSRFCVGK